MLDPLELAAVLAGCAHEAAAVEEEVAAVAIALHVVQRADVRARPQRVREGAAVADGAVLFTRIGPVAGAWYHGAATEIDECARLKVGAAVAKACVIAC